LLHALSAVTVLSQTPTSPLNISFFSDANCVTPLSTLQRYPTYLYWPTLVPSSSVWTNWSAIGNRSMVPCPPIQYNQSFQLIANTQFTCILPNATGLPYGASPGGSLTVTEYWMNQGGGNPTGSCTYQKGNQVYAGRFQQFGICQPLLSWYQYYWVPSDPFFQPDCPVNWIIHCLLVSIPNSA